MKKTLFVLIAIVFSFCFIVPAMAADLSQPIEKLSDGTMEIIKSPLEIYDHTKTTMDDCDVKVVGFFKGLIQSPFHVVMKAGHGAVDVLTFPVE